MRYGYGIPLPSPDDDKPAPGATLSDDEIRAMVKKGELKPKDLTTAQQERLGLKRPEQ